MELIPAIDLKAGRCVRLYKGRFDEVTRYDVDPLELARRYSELGAAWLHVVDLDGARDGQPGNAGIVRDILAETSLSVQVGGGVRSRASVETLLECGASRVVVGSKALNSPREVTHWIEDFGTERIVLALDVRVDGDVPAVLVHGWTQQSSHTLWDAIDLYQDAGLQHVLCTDVDRDGAMEGPNFELYRESCRRYPDLAVQASGGVRDAADLEALAATGATAAISGRALLDGALDDTEVLPFLPNA
jgi:phosphoribosylformimino-5-aminoimidazole carboxamide ribotide isomerase